MNKELDKVDKVKSLVEISLRYITMNIRNLKLMTRYYFLISSNPIIDVFIMKKLLKPLSNESLNIDQIKCLELLSPSLSDDIEIDKTFWKCQVETTFHTRPILMPFSELVEYTNDLKLALENNCEDEEACVLVLRKLRDVTFSAELGKLTGIGVVVNKLRKRQNQAEIVQIASTLMQKWKKIYSAQQAEGAADSILPATATKSTKLATWRELYYFCVSEEEARFQQVSKKISEKVKIARVNKRTAQAIEEGSLSRSQKAKIARTVAAGKSRSTNSKSTKLIVAKSTIKFVNIHENQR